MIEFMNLVTTISPNFGSGIDLALLSAMAAGHELALRFDLVMRSNRMSWLARILLRPLGAVLGRR